MSYQYRKKSYEAVPSSSSKTTSKSFTNSITKYASQALKGSESKRVDANLLDSVAEIVSGNAVYIERFHCEEDDYETLERLANDLDECSSAEEEEEGMINWSKHLKQENPEFSETFRTIVERMAEYFDVDVFATRLNFYRDGSDWKPYHHDSHAFGANGRKEDFTMGASFGAPRALSFLHESSASSFEFPQKNGDVFAFSSEVNAAMKHGVPQLSGQEQFAVNPRFSIIAWGSRRSLNARNSSVSSSSEKTTISVDESRMPWHHNTKNNEENEQGGSYEVLLETPSSAKNVNERVMSNNEVSELVQKFIKRKRNETRKTSKALVEHLKENNGIDDFDFVRMKKHARKYQRDDTISAKEFVESALDSRVSVDDLRNLASYLPNEQKKIELTNELQNYSSALPFLS